MMSTTAMGVCPLQGHSVVPEKEIAAYKAESSLMICCSG